MNELNDIVQCGKAVDIYVLYWIAMDEGRVRGKGGVRGRRMRMRGKGGEDEDEGKDRIG